MVRPVMAPRALVVVKPTTRPVASRMGLSPSTDQACASSVATSKMAARRPPCSDPSGAGASLPRKGSTSCLRASGMKASTPASLQCAKSRSALTLKPFSTRSALTAAEPKGRHPSARALSLRRIWSKRGAASSADTCSSYPASPVKEMRKTSASTPQTRKLRICRKGTEAASGQSACMSACADGPATCRISTSSVQSTSSTAPASTSPASSSSARCCSSHARSCCA
mmetsp:Transcript_20506/g.60712  ORF Transcript_20506/g.60712 Transcript_20506/m.60712 type:complete len:226 (+) Transcript_20506:271-948(+)